MIDYQNNIIYYTPYYYVLKQFSRSMRPGDTVLGVQNPNLPEKDLHVCATRNADGTIAVNVLNTGESLAFPLQIGEYVATINMPANSVETIIVKL